jgi:hypothetical protein
MTMYVPSPPPASPQMELLLMSSVVDFPAKTSALPVEAPVSVVNAAACGPSTLGSLARYDRDTSLWRTWQLCLDGDLALFSETFPRAGMMQNGELYRQQTWARRTAASGYGLWPIPRAGDGMVSQLRMLEAIQQSGGHKSRLEDAVAMWPTPHGFSQDGRSNGPSGNELGRAVNRSIWPTPGGSRPHDTDEVSGRLANEIGGSLNPNFVEWLLGLPKDWTLVD